MGIQNVNDVSKISVDPTWKSTKIPNNVILPPNLTGEIVDKDDLKVDNVLVMLVSTIRHESIQDTITNMGTEK